MAHLVFKVKPYFCTLLYFLVCLIFAGCNFSSAPKMSAYLDEHINRIEVMDVVYDKDYPTDEDKVLCIPSNEDTSIQFYIRNLQNTTLGLDGNLTTEQDSKILTLSKLIDKEYKNFTLTNDASSETDAYTYKFNSEYSVLTLNLTKEILYELEKKDNGGPGLDLNPYFSLVSKDSTYTTSIEPYKELVRVNSAPPPVQGATVMVDSSFARNQSTYYSESIGKYVLCFNLPEKIFDKDGAHTDVTRAKITGLSNETAGTLAKGVDLNIDLENLTFDNTYLTNQYSNTISSNTYNNDAVYGSGLPAVTFKADSYPVYILDNAYATRKDSRNYTITLYDSKGLSSSFTVNTLSKKLRKVTANVENGESIELDSDRYGNITSYFNLVLSAPTQTYGSESDFVSDVNIRYYIYYRAKGDSELVLLDSGLKSDVYNLPVNKDGYYYVEAYATKSGYIDSDLYSFSFYIGPRVVITIDVEAPQTYVLVMSLDQQLFEYSKAKKADKYRTITLNVEVYTEGELVPYYQNNLGTPSLTLYDRGEKIAEQAENNPYKIILPEIEKLRYDILNDKNAGTYRLYAEITYMGVEYSSEFEIALTIDE